MFDGFFPWITAKSPGISRHRDLSGAFLVPCFVVALTTPYYYNFEEFEGVKLPIYLTSEAYFPVKNNQRVYSLVSKKK